MPIYVGNTKNVPPEERRIQRNSGKGAAKRRRTFARHKKDSFSLEDARRMFDKELKLRRDVSAELCQAIILGNQHAIFEAFSYELRKGNTSVLRALCDRAFGAPAQDIGFNPERPFKLEIEVIGLKGGPVTIAGAAPKELKSGNEGE